MNVGREHCVCANVLRNTYPSNQVSFAQSRILGIYGKELSDFPKQPNSAQLSNYLIPFLH